MNTEKNTVTTIIALICVLGIACSAVPGLATVILVVLLMVTVGVAVKVIA